MGITWAHETADEFGAGQADVAAAYWAARQVLRADRWWAQVETLAPQLPVDVEEMLHHAVVAAVETLTRHYLSAPAVELGRRVARDQPVAAELAAGDGPAGQLRSDYVADLVAAGVNRQLAEAFGRLPAMATAGDIGVLNRALGAAVADVVAAATGSRHRTWAAIVHHPAGRAAGGQPVGTMAGPAAVGRRGQHPARRAWRQWPARSRSPAGSGVLPGGPGVGMDAGDRVLMWFARRERRMARFRRLAAQVRASGTDAHSVAALAVRALGELVEPLP